MIVVHVTHEAVEKIGGIGTVISGLMTAKAYAQAVGRTILLGPVLSTDRPAAQRLGPDGEVFYSSLDDVDTGGWGEKFRPIERTYDVGVIYGRRPVVEEVTGRSRAAEVLLIDVFHANVPRLNLFKTELFKKYAIPSAPFEHVWEYEQYVRLAEPGVEALKVIGADAVDEEVVLLSHEYMGMPTALRAMMTPPPGTLGADQAARKGYRTVFYAHEVASARPVVEKTPGHDTMFYNVMSAAAREGRTMEEVFPGVFDNYKHALVKAARYCDHVFAVGDYICDELRFLDRHFRTAEIDLVYNGVPAEEITPADRQASRGRMAAYADRLFGRPPTWVFTHVARPVLSKGIWRDLRVLHEIEPLLAARGESAVYFMLGTLAGQRRTSDVRHMERVYGWPVSHEEGYPDAACGEEVVSGMVDYFNREHQAVSAVLVNQWGWGPDLCGLRMSDQMTFADIRRGTDVEFGLSVYEPFGISQLEPLCYGAMCVVSNVCGCAGFVDKVAAGADVSDSVLIGSFLNVDGAMSVDELMTMPISQRDRIESVEAQRLAGEIVQRLCRDDGQAAQRMCQGFGLAKQMSWEHVVDDYFMPALGRAVHRK